MLTQFQLVCRQQFTREIIAFVRRWRILKGLFNCSSLTCVYLYLLLCLSHLFFKFAYRR